MPTCPSVELLQRFLDETGSAWSDGILAAHVHECLSCQAVLDRLSDAPDLHPARARACALRAQAALADTPSQLASAETRAGNDLRFLTPSPHAGDLGMVGAYRIQGILGRGGMGIVLSAFDMSLARPVALKVLRPELADTQSRWRFLREARSAAALRDDHVVTIYHVGEDRGLPFFTMEVLAGLSLADWLKTGHAPTVPEILHIGRGIALGLAAAHERGLIHRDVKPANIWLETRPEDKETRRQGDRETRRQTLSPCLPVSLSPCLDCRVKLLDFGLARGDSSEEPLTQVGMLVGTPQYMAPEQASGEPVDYRCDLFSLGAVLYQLCTGRPPFASKGTLATLRSLAVDAPPRPGALNPAVPAALSALIMSLLDKDPTRRPASARGVADALAQIEPVAPRARAGRARVYRWLTLSGGGLLLVLAAVLVWRPGPSVEQEPAHAGSPVPLAPSPQPLSPEYRGEGLMRFEQQTNSLGMSLVAIPPGQFLMGSPDADNDAADNEKPRHEVTLTRRFWLAAHAVTVGQFRQFVEDRAYHGGQDFIPERESPDRPSWGYVASKRAFESGRQFTWAHPGWPQSDDHPVTSVSWNDALAFCRWLSRKEATVYELPTEAEWEYACRAGTTTRFWAGAKAHTLEGKANVADLSLLRADQAATWSGPWDDGYPFTAPVGRFHANPWGLYDMLGNVWQWCLDSPRSYDARPTTDPHTPAVTYAILRGGGFYSWNTSAAQRRFAQVGTHASDVGFRVVRRPATGE